MKESVTYQGILEEGAVKALQKVIVGQGRVKFGAPRSNLAISIEAITDVERLNRMSLHILQATSWQELLAVE